MKLLDWEGGSVNTLQLRGEEGIISSNFKKMLMLKMFC